MKITFRSSLLISILIHLLIMGTTVLSKITVEIPVAQVDKIQITLVSMENEPKTFVETEASGINEEVDTNYLSDKTQKVEVETVSTHNPGEGSNAVSESEQDKNVNYNKDLTLKELSTNFSEEDYSERFRKNNNNDNNINLENKNIEKSQNGIGDRYPIFAENVEEGDKTSLNTIEYKYSSFYKRMREQVGNTWTPMVEKNVSIELPAGKYRTVILLKINTNGEVIGLKLDKSSGVELLDEIAYQAFMKIRIFQNPPKDLFNGKEYLYIPWTLELRN